MKKLILGLLLTLITSSGLSFLVLFEGEINQVSAWWEKWSRDSATLPFSPYKKRRANAAELEFHGANKISVEDNRLFWKGDRADLMPEITTDGKLVKIIVASGGKGYSNSVTAKITGANHKEFKLGRVHINKGSIAKIEIIKSSTWTNEPLAYLRGEDAPYSGTIETKFPSGQIIEESNYLSGKRHGKVIRYDRTGIPVANKDYVHGKKHGTHIFWFPVTIEPSGYIPKVSKDGDLIPTLWTFLHLQAKEKFKDDYGSHESNQWVVQNYRLKGGSFQVKQLEHWEKNVKEGLFEGFDEFSNKTFKDEYKNGLRIKHKIFDKSI
jgi:antitoxin component YwqK of YwqJK toxin-antitoxin module